MSSNDSFETITRNKKQRIDTVPLTINGITKNVCKKWINNNCDNNCNTNYNYNYCKLKLSNI